MQLGQNYPGWEGILEGGAGNLKLRVNLSSPIVPGVLLEIVITLQYLTPRENSKKQPFDFGE